MNTWDRIIIYKEC